jgi:hypothetical protein
MRRALTDRLKAAARTGRWTLPQLQRHIAYDRLLERLFRRDEGWIVKGAAALLARDIGVRATIDVDLYRDDDIAVLEADLRLAAVTDLNDWFAFEVGQRRAAGDTAVALRLPVTATIGATTWASFHVDLAGRGLRMTGKPQHVPALAQMHLPSLTQGGYKVYPLVDHIADKLAALYELHGSMAMPSTRYRDLVDLVAISLRSSVPAAPLIRAVRSEEARRGIQLPDRLVVPDRPLWLAGYAAEARRSLLSEAETLPIAIEMVSRFLDPVLAGTARGIWDRSLRIWAART